MSDPTWENEPLPDGVKRYRDSREEDAELYAALRKREDAKVRRVRIWLLAPSIFVLLGVYGYMAYGWATAIRTHEQLVELVTQEVAEQCAKKIARARTDRQRKGIELAQCRSTEKALKEDLHDCRETAVVGLAKP